MFSVTVFILNNVIIKEIRRFKIQKFEILKDYCSLVFLCSTVQLIGKDYETNNCRCRIKDVACIVW